MRNQVSLLGAIVQIISREVFAKFILECVKITQYSFESFLSDNLAGNNAPIEQIPKLSIHFPELSLKFTDVKNTFVMKIVRIVQFGQRFSTVGLVIPEGVIEVKKNTLILLVRHV